MLTVFQGQHLHAKIKPLSAWILDDFSTLRLLYLEEKIEIMTPKQPIYPLFVYPNSFYGL
jgi:hypothetical protein